MASLPSDPTALQGPRAEVERASGHYYFSSLQQDIDHRTKAFFVERSTPFVNGQRSWKLSYVDGRWTDLLAAKGLQETAKRLGLKSIGVGPSTGTSDMRQFTAAGTPYVFYSPCNGYNPHCSGEHYLLDDLPRIFLFYLTLAES